ncbi:MAG: family 78 glycoside hydrolase catalytic domain [Bacteroidales bacterium]|nr:family 78 glycoside hydrolase catalytic domain [Bacteroidales bacterium]
MLSGIVSLQILLFSVQGQSTPGVVNLRTEYKTNPVGIDEMHPGLSWEVVSDERSVMQTAYQIWASLSPDGLKSDKSLYWNTGKKLSEQSVHIPYAGTELKSGQRIWWKVKIWDNKGRESDWSEPAFWEMGLLNESDWKASWIEPDIQEDVSVSTPCPFLRKEFRLKKNIRQARIYVTCHGLYQLNLNGEKVGDQLFTPGWTSYHKRLQYQVYDVTKQVQEGPNAIGVILGDGWYRGYLVWEGNRNLYGDKVALLLHLRVIYEDGSEEYILSNDTWKAATGPILKSDIYNGETYDARLEFNGWDRPGFNDKLWSGVLVKDYSKEILIASEGPAVRITQTIKPIEKIITPKGELVFDLGQNIVGWVQFKLKGAAGTKITLRHAEVLDKDGNFYTDNLRAAKAEDKYIFKGEGLETFEPHFTFHGFRYIQVKDYPDEISPDDISGRVIHSDMTPTGDFECSDTLINRLQKNIQWGLRGNFLDVPTDCPQRDERLGWTGDAQAFAPTACFNMDAASFYTRWMKDFIADQNADGAVPWVVPMVVGGGAGTGWSEGYGATGWADAAVIIPWTVYQTYGDARILETQYESMKAWVEFMRKMSGDSYLVNKGFHFGDWLAFATTQSDYPGATTDKDLIATAYFYHSTSLLQKIAGILGKEQDAKDYTELKKKIQNAFQKEFITETGRLASNTQTAYVLALAFDLVPENLKASAARRLADDVRKFGHITTGFLGTPLISHVLTETGYPDLAYMLLFRKKYPSWLYPVTMGATTIWERWDGIKPDGSFQNAGMNSFNHYAYGAVGNWLYTKVAGISIDPEFPGYKHFIIKPYLTDKLYYAQAEYHSVYGDIKSQWDRKNDRLKLHIVIPANTTANIELPVRDITDITEGRTPISELSEIIVKGITDNRVILYLGSGTYDFEAKIN